MGLLASPIDPASQRKELNYLIEECFKLATVQVRYQMAKLHKPGIMGDLSAKDIAVDAIAPLFTPADDGFIRHLHDVFCGWSPTVVSEEQAQFMLVSVLSHRVKQHIHTMMRESDPFFAKILDSLNYHIKKERLVKTEKLKVCYISDAENAESEITYFGYEDLLTIQATLFSIKHISISSILLQLKKDDQPAAIPLLALAKRIKEVNLSYENPVITCHKTETEFDVHSLSATAKKTVLEKLRHSYLDKGKLNHQEADLIERAIAEMLSDLKDGGIKPGLYHYFEMIDSSICPEVYKQKYHNILEYLLKVLKKELAQLLLVRHEMSE